MTQPRNGFQRGAAGAPLDRRNAQPILNGAPIANATIAGGVNVITSTGAYGVFTIPFAPAIFGIAPAVVAWPSLSSGGSFVVLSIAAVTKDNFQFYMMGFAPGQIFIPAAQTVTVEWIALGS